MISFFISAASVSTLWLKGILVREQKWTLALGLVFKLTLQGKNKILTITTWAVAVLRYRGGLLKCRKDKVMIINWKQDKDNKNLEGW